METIKKVEEVALINKHETWSFLKLWYCDYSVSSSSRSAPDVPVIPGKRRSRQRARFDDPNISERYFGSRSDATVFGINNCTAI